MRRRVGARGWAALALVASWGLALPASAGAGAIAASDEVVPPARERLLEGLRRLRDPQAPPIEALAAELRAAASGESLALLEILARERVPASGSARAQRLSEVQRELILALLARAPAFEVRGAMEALLVEPEHARWQLVPIEVLGAIGGTKDIPSVLARAEAARLELGIEALGPVLKRTGVRLFRRDAESIDGVAKRWRQLDPGLLEALLEAAGECGDARALPWVTEVVGAGSPAVAVAIAQIPLLARPDAQELDARLVADLRRLLDPERPELARSAALALAALGDEDCIEALVPLLGTEDEGLRSNALWALRRISGQSFPATPALWSRWHAAELEWFEQRFEAALEELSDPDEARASAAIREIAARSLRRAWRVEALALALEHPSPSLRGLACRVLGDIGHPTAEPLLRQMLEDHDESVGRAAAQALQRCEAARAARR